MGSLVLDLYFTTPAAATFVVVTTGDFSANPSLDPATAALSGVLAAALNDAPADVSLVVVGYSVSTNLTLVRSASAAQLGITSGLQPSDLAYLNAAVSEAIGALPGVTVTLTVLDDGGLSASQARRLLSDGTATLSLTATAGSYSGADDASAGLASAMSGNQLSVPGAWDASFSTYPQAVAWVRATAVVRETEAGATASDSSALAYLSSYLSSGGLAAALVGTAAEGLLTPASGSSPGGVTLSAPPPPPSPPPPPMVTQLGDVTALLAVRSAWGPVDPSWSLSDDPCGTWAPWAGIGCDASGGVTSLTLQALALAASGAGKRLLPSGAVLPHAALGSLTQLRLLNLEYAGLVGNLEDGGHPGEGLAQLTGLTSLKLGHQSVSRGGAPVRFLDTHRSASASRSARNGAARCAPLRARLLCVAPPTIP